VNEIKYAVYVMVRDAANRHSAIDAINMVLSP